MPNPVCSKCGSELVIKTMKNKNKGAFNYVGCPKCAPDASPEPQPLPKPSHHAKKPPASVKPKPEPKPEDKPKVHWLDEWI